MSPKDARGGEAVSANAADEFSGSAVSTNRSQQSRIDDIEILRAVAIIFVLVEHAPVNLFPWLKLYRGFTYFGGWDGVDLFFAISGFVIARSLMPGLVSAPDLARFANTALAFWIRRIWRLLPSAWLWLALIMMATVFFNASGVFGSFKANFEATVAAFLDIANLRMDLVFGRFEPGASFPYWSLSLEEQFYIVFPFLVLISGKRLPLVVGIGVLLQLFLDRNGATPVSLTLNLFRSDALLLGVLIALWSAQPTYKLFGPVFLKGRPIAGFMVFAALVFLLGVAGSASLHLVGSFRYGLVALISAVLVLIASYNNGIFCPKGPLKQAMLWIGSRSYTIYLIHIPAFFLAREIWFRLQPPGTEFTDRFAIRFTYTAAILLLIFTELNYRLVETPLRRHGKRIAQRIAARRADKGLEPGKVQ
jgi:peptidoglycan/LPS O-acetylase OafA/YrhL